jgi:hypothetical protein
LDDAPGTAIRPTNTTLKRKNSPAFASSAANAPGVQNGRVLIGELASDPVWREAVFVDDMKEVAHAGGIKSERCQLPVTNV